jgi:hypothetical protein
MYFDAYGPFVIEQSGDKEIKRSQQSFWTDVRCKSAAFGYHENELEAAIGCYVFGIRHGEKMTPWYVGQTVAKAGFKGEIFQEHKIKKYNNDDIKSKNGARVMFLFPLLTPDPRFSKSRSPYNLRLITWTEQMLFGLAIAKNPMCLNMRDTKFLRECVVNGVLGVQSPGRPESMAQGAKLMLL